MKINRLLMACMVLLIGSVSAAGPASAAPAVVAPSVAVVPSTGLAGGDTVSVTGVGLTPSATVRVIQCNEFFNDPNFDCPNLTTTTADSAGNVSINLTLNDPVYQNTPPGNSIPVYCRADICRIFLVWNNQAGMQQVASSHTLNFKGSPATITANPATNLRPHQWVRVSGTVFGASGHTLLIREEACYFVDQGEGCEGARPAVWTVVRPSGYYAAYYPVRRFLADGTDCNNQPIPGATCELNVTVLDRKGHPDDSFGVSAFGQPGARLTFRAG